MDWDEAQVPKRQEVLLGENLDRLSIGELEARIGLLEAEIERVRAEISKKQAHGAKAAEIFKR